MTGLVLVAFGVAKWVPTTTISSNGLSSSSSAVPAPHAAGAMAPIAVKTPIATARTGAHLLMRPRTPLGSLMDDDSTCALIARFALFSNVPPDDFAFDTCPHARCKHGR